MSREEFDPFGREFSGSREFGGSRDFDDLREQMARKRDEFFNDRGEQGFFSSLPRSSFAGFPTSSNSPTSSTLPGNGGRHSFAAGSGRPTASAGGQPWPQRNKEDDIFQNKDSIPINVIHERGSADSTLPRAQSPGPTHTQNIKHRYGSGPGSRNTTDLPAASSKSASRSPGPGVPGGPGSPRLERAHSEPPAKFNERRKFAVPTYTTIPESGEQGGSSGQHKPAFQSGNLGVNPIKTSASAPSVPESQQPVPPPRRSPPPQAVRPSTMNLGGSPNNKMNSQQQQQQQGVPTGSQVRHIPIHVEGRQAPIFNTHIKTNSGDDTCQPSIPLPAAGQTQQQPPVAGEQLPFSKPSDYYPPGVQRIRSRDSTTCSEPGSPMPPPRHPADEPTTPQGPPPGPIPMGFVPTVPSVVPVTEPTTPLGPPPGPIPMGYLPTSDPAPPHNPIPMGYLPTSDPAQPNNMSDKNPNNNEPQSAPSQPQNQQASAAADTTDKSATPPPPPVRKGASKSPSPKPSTGAGNVEKQNTPPPTEQQKASEYRIPIKVEGSSDPSPRPTSSQQIPQAPPPPPSAATKTSAPAAGQAQKPQEPLHEDPTMAKVLKIGQLADDLEPRINALKTLGKERDWLDEQLTTIFLKYDAITVPEGKPHVLKTKKELLQRLKQLEKTLYAVSADS